MSARKKAPKKTSIRASKPVRATAKSNAAGKAKTAKIATRSAKPVRSAKKAAVKASKAAPRARAAAKSKSARAKSGRIPAPVKAVAKPRKSKAAAKAKAKVAVQPAGLAPARAAGPAMDRVANKKSESANKGHETLPVTGQAKTIQNKAPAHGDSQRNSSQPNPVATEAAPSARPAKSANLEKQGAQDETVAQKTAKSAANRHGFKTNEFIVYPAHGVGQIVAVEEQEVAGFRLELFVITFVKDKMTLRVPTGKVSGVGMRKLAEPEAVKKALDILLGRARIKRTMWSRRAQEYETKINSGDLAAISEVVRDLYRSEAQPEQSYSERQLYEAALDRMAREVAVVQRLTESEALKAIDQQLQRGQRRGVKVEAEAATPGAAEPDVEEAA
jgi:CarD family transcriptional regulator